MLKFKTNSIKVYQACHKGYDGLNDTTGLVVARAERRMISNVTTGVQFLGCESRNGEMRNGKLGNEEMETKYKWSPS